MNVQTQSLRDILEVEHLWIPLGDGRRLAARIWMPGNAASSPAPAVLEYIPYRKRDGTAPRDESMYPYLAARGYACVRVDMRGNGDSEGLMHDEYLQQELDDGVEVIAWIANQPWCSGAVGIQGISWGGFNGLQIAALRPPALKAVITICSTDDRYGDDIHYRGGSLLNDNLGWSAAMMAYSSRPPDPLMVGETWRDMWLDRLQNMPFLAANWLEHQRRDSYWLHGSVCEDFDAIAIPVLAVGGWADSYTNAIPRLLCGLSAPVAGLIGPWGHRYPHLGVPGPAIDFRQEMAIWWDHWLAGRPAARDVPVLRAYMLDGEDAGHGEDERRGFWVSEPAWPSPNVETHTLFLNADRTLDPVQGRDGQLAISSSPTTGLAGGRFYPKLGRPDLPVDQRSDDAGSLVFDGPPLDAPLDLLGAPVVELDLSVDRPQANLAIRLCHVAPDGKSHRIALGVLNLCHRDSHAKPQPLEPGQRYHVRVQLDQTGYRVPSGHRLRIAISTAYWPMLWPSPKPATLTLFAGSSRLDLPARHGAEVGAPLLPEMEAMTLEGFEMLREGRSERRISHDLIAGETIVEHVDDAGLKRLNAHGLESGLCARETYGIRSDDPLSAWARCELTTEIGRGDWRVRTESRSSMRADADTFYLKAELAAFENEREVFRNTWQRAIPRDLV